jgi:hypothetical protein
MYPPGYETSTRKDPVPLDLLFTDALSADRSLACREAGYPYTKGDQSLIRDRLPYRETREYFLPEHKIQIWILKNG